jgi:hypothetical protein
MPSTEPDIDGNIEMEWNEDKEVDCNEENHPQAQMADPPTRYKFTKDMVDILDIHIILKVFSHQLTKSLNIKTQGEYPAPNLFITSGNQYADNAAEQCHNFQAILPTAAQHQPKLAHEIFIAPFSARYVFTHKGYTSSKSASTVLKEKANDELILRLQHRRSQGLLQRLLPFIGLKVNELGEETTGRDIMRNTAPCHTRKIYNSSELASNIYQRYFLHLSAEEKENYLPHLDPKWQKDQATVAIIKACPFCYKPCPGNLTHLHLYCQNELLVNARHLCYDQIEKSLTMMYTFATKEEQKTNKNNPHINSPHYSTNLQQAIEAAARSTECLERPICTGSKTTNILNEARQTNKAVLLSREIQIAIAQQQMQPEKWKNIIEAH